MSNPPNSPQLEPVSHWIDRVLTVDPDGTAVGFQSAPRLAADNLALPTAPDVLATMLAYDGTTLDMFRTATAIDGQAMATTPGVAASGLTISDGTNFRLATSGSAQNDGSAATNIQASVLYVYNGTTFDRVRGDASENLTGSIKSVVYTREGNPVKRASALTDAEGAYALGVGPMAYNNASWDRVRNNMDITLLASAARTTTQTSADLVNYNADALIVVVDITAYTAGGLTVTIDRKDGASGKYINILTSALLASAATTILQVGPVIAAAANTIALAYMPRTFRIVVTVSDATSITYSVGYSLVRAR